MRELEKDIPDDLFGNKAMSICFPFIPVGNDPPSCVVNLNNNNNRCIL